MERLTKHVWSALAAVKRAGANENVVATGQVQDLEVDEEGRVRFAFLLRAEDPGELVREVREAVQRVVGVSEVKVNVRLPQATGGGRPAPRPRPGLRPGSVPAPTPQPGLLPAVQHVVAVSSGKGGVGKSMVAANLAAALALEGRRVGLLDADVYGPDIPIMFGERRRPRVTGERGKEMIEPLDAHGVRLMSLGFLLESEQPAIMRGPLIAGIMKQFLEQVAWGALDYLIVDMPPGTGDAQLSLVQTIDVAGAVMVTTPQDVATGDVFRGIKMFERVNTRILGVVENMGPLACPHCGERIELFGSSGGRRLAEQANVPFLAMIPLDPAVREAGDSGSPTVVAHPDSAAGRALRELARAVIEAVEGEQVGGSVGERVSG
ncbi:MAG: Mrp/NBP35 family ATP-binding protein [Gemmatimonadetes bacterium]|nr:Mrp/NBP35 family ATP-binding protein [Gemmatimonadota bacterium]